MTFPDPLMTKADIAELLRCCERTVERQVKLGAFPPPQKFGKESLWFQSVVHAWLTRRREEQMGWAQNTSAAMPATQACDPSPPQAAPAAAAAVPERKSRVKPRSAAATVCSIFTPQQLAQARRRDVTP